MRIFLRSEGYDSRDRSLWLRAWHACCSHGIIHCAVLPQRSSALCCIHLSSLRLLVVLVRTRPARFVKRLCALLVNLLFTTAVLSPRLRDSTTAWSAEVFNATAVVVVRSKNSCHISLSLALLRDDQPCMHLNYASTRLRPRAPVSASLAVYRHLLNAVRPPCLSCDASASAECFEASLPLLPGSARAPSTSETSRSLISSMALARGTHAYGLVLPGPPGVTPGTHLIPLSSTFSLCGPSSHLVEHLLEHLHPPLFRCSGTPGCFHTLHYLQQHFITCPPAVGYSSGPIPGCFSFFASICQLLPPNHSFRSIHGTSSFLTSQASGTHKPLGRIEITIFHAQLDHNVDDIGLPCRNPQHLMLTRQSFSRASL